MGPPEAGHRRRAAASSSAMSRSPQGLAALASLLNLKTVGASTTETNCAYKSGKVPEEGENGYLWVPHEDSCHRNEVETTVGEEGLLPIFDVWGRSCTS